MFRDEHGVELFDLPNAPRPGEDVPAPVRFLPNYDNVVLGHADRTRIVDDALRAREVCVPRSVRCSSTASWAALWKFARDRSSATLRVEAVGQLGNVDANAVAEEGERLLAFAAPDAKSRDLRFETVSR